MDRRVEVFRREAARIGRGGTGRRYPASARAMAVKYARAQIAKGVTVAAIAAELGVPGQTLTYWMCNRYLSPICRAAQIEATLLRCSPPPAPSVRLVAGSSAERRAARGDQDPWAGGTSMTPTGLRSCSRSSVARVAAQYLGASSRKRSRGQNGSSRIRSRR